MLFVLYAVVLAACAALRSPVPRYWTALLGSGRLPGVRSVTGPVRRHKIIARAGLLIQLAGLIAALSAPLTRWPAGPAQVSAGLGVVAAVRFWPSAARRGRGRSRRDRGRWHDAGWRVELGERRPLMQMTKTAGALSAAVRPVPTLPRTVDVRLVWAGTAVTAGAGFTLLAAAARLARPERATLLAAGAFLLVYAAYQLHRLGQRIVMPTATQAMHRDPRPPVVLLRAFAEDATLVRAAVSGRRQLLERLSPLRSVRFEEALARRLDEYGPVIAVTAPGTTLPLLGAAAQATTGDRWTELVSGWMRQAAMIVVVAAPRQVTPGLRWELNAITALGAWSRTVLVVPPWGRAETRRRWASFEPVLGAALDRPVRLPVDSAAAVAALVRPDGMLAVVAAEKSEWSYPAAVRAAVAHLAPATNQTRTLPPPPARPTAATPPTSPQRTASVPWSTAGPPSARLPGAAAGAPEDSRWRQAPPPLIASVLSSNRGGPREVAASSIEFQTAWAANASMIILVTGLISVMIWPLGIIALLVGRRQIRKLDQAPYPLPGRRAAVTAVVLGAIGTALTLLIVLPVLVLLATALAN